VASTAALEVLQSAGRRRARRREWLAVLNRAVRTPRGAIGLSIVGVVVLIAAIGPAFAPYPADAFVTRPFANPSLAFPLGGDVLGRDVLSRTLDGGWQLLLMAAVATLLGVAAGAAFGVTAAYFGGRWDGIIMRTVDIVLAFPQLVFALLLVSILGPKIWLIVLAVAISHAPQVARVTRAAALDICERDYVRAAQIIGMVELGLRLTYSILVIAGLSFLGFGLQPPAPSWGYMINENRIGLVANPWGVLAPVLLIAALTIGMNTLTDAIARASLGVGRGADDALLPGITAAGAMT